VPGTGLEVVNWSSVAASLVEDGWVRLESTISGRTCARLVRAAPLTWEPEPEEIGTIRQNAVSTGLYFDRELARFEKSVSRLATR
jgi:hypothetical protein